MQARLVVQHFGGYPEPEGTARNQVGLPGGLHNLEFRLARDQQPIHRRIQVVVIRVADLQLFGQAGCMPVPRRTELGAGKDHLLHNHAHHQVAFSARLGGQQRVQPQLPNHVEHCLDVFMQFGADDTKCLLGGNQVFPSEYPPEELNLLGGKVRQVGEGPVLDRAVLAVAFPQQHGRWGRTVGNDGYVHADIIRASINKARCINALYMTTQYSSKLTQLP
ncbi:MAG: hypothetical protein ACOX1P_10485 [Thermoguttaceae bacterium]